MSTKPRETLEAVERRRTAAFLRGWDDSERAYAADSLQPIEDRYDYMRGWWACGDWRFGRGPGPYDDFRRAAELHASLTQEKAK